MRETRRVGREGAFASQQKGWCLDADVGLVDAAGSDQSGQAQQQHEGDPARHLFLLISLCPGVVSAEESGPAHPCAGPPLSLLQAGSSSTKGLASGTSAQDSR